ncbi:hypothetical protein BT63DRAFT_460670 [Microthyrium microscopicum]|uniref:Uncharacterized protein n=1 Tax=Microthyrium microscopicum TaxID=703497 RepID=A0A6A6TWC9_9PEZI|nr:hypothetical protein BT63DRAFT_460670 [Microthyrium microscopicum]
MSGANRTNSSSLANDFYGAIANASRTNTLNGSSQVYWRPEPDGRGTWGLLSTRFWSRCWRNTVWVVKGIFAPELVVVAALKQYMSAQKLTKIIRTRLSKSEKGKGKIDWSTKHSYFAQMGGFVVKTEQPDDEGFIPGSPTLSLTAHAVAVLAETGNLPKIAKETIEDKSKSNKIGKLMAYLQGCWLLVQCAARLAEKRPISLLEIHVSAHVLCALVIFSLWFSKPLGVEEPIVIQIPDKLIAAMWMFSDIPSRRYQTNTCNKARHEELPITSLITTWLPQRSEYATGDTVLHLDPLERISVARNPFDDTFAHQSPNCPIGLSIYNIRDGSSAPLEVGIQKIKEDEILRPLGWGPKPWSPIFRTKERSKKYHTGGLPYDFRGIYAAESTAAEVSIDAETLRRWTLAAQSIAEHPEIWDQSRRKVVQNKSLLSFDESLELWEYPLKELAKRTYLQPEIQNEPGPDLLAYNTIIHHLLVMTLASIYGGLHTLAWFEYFPTVLERWLWRAASCIVSGAFVVESLAALLFSVDDRDFLYNYWVADVLFAFFQVPVGITFLFYALARAYLPVEAFVSLRDVPSGVYETISWSQYIPHL